MERINRVHMFTGVLCLLHPHLWPGRVKGHFYIPYQQLNNHTSVFFCPLLFSHAPPSVHIFPLCFFTCFLSLCLLILSSILTSFSLSLIHAHLLPRPTAPPVPSSVTLLSRGERAGAGLTEQEVFGRWPLPVVCSARVCLMARRPTLKANCLSAHSTRRHIIYGDLSAVIIRIYEKTLVSISQIVWTYSKIATTSLSFPLVSQFFQMARVPARLNRKNM